jgi:hypothetical protein
MNIFGLHWEKGRNVIRTVVDDAMCESVHASCCVRGADIAALREFSPIIDDKVEKVMTHRASS